MFLKILSHHNSFNKKFRYNDLFSIYCNSICLLKSNDLITTIIILDLQLDKTGLIKNTDFLIDELLTIYKIRNIIINKKITDDIIKDYEKNYDVKIYLI